MLSGVLRFLASLLIEIASSRGAGVHACDRRRLSFLFRFFHFWLFVFFGWLVLSGVLCFLASLLIEIASPRGAGVHACDRHRLSFLFRLKVALKVASKPSQRSP